MSDFNKQIRNRQTHDKLHLHRAVQTLTGAVNRETIYDSGMDLNAGSDAALYDICRFFGLPDKELSSDLTELEEKLNYLMDSRGVMRRRVTLDGDWWKNMSGPVLGRMKADGTVIALLPDALNRYFYIDIKENKYQHQREGVTAWCDDGGRDEKHNNCVSFVLA